MLRIALGSAMLAALAALCALALPRGLGDLRGFEARILVRSWEAKHRQPSIEEWTEARSLLRAAHALDPGQPNYLEDIARLYEYRALPQALEYQREAARRRPGSPYTWANIALLKARLAETGGEFETALRNAAMLGPWEPEVQMAIADAGFRRWDALAPETRAALRANAARALRWQDAKLFELARRTGRLDVLCAAPGVQRSPRAIACI